MAREGQGYPCCQHDMMMMMMTMFETKADRLTRMNRRCLPQGKGFMEENLCYAYGETIAVLFI